MGDHKSGMGQVDPNSLVVRRIMRELKELADDDSEYFAVAPLENNIFEWHFTLRGPPDSPYAGGLYHGRIVLPPQYPLKPPNVMFLTPNGRFSVGEMICLSISAYHQETWQPVRTALLALVSFMPSKGEGAIGALDHPPDVCKRLAASSVKYTCPTCGLSNEELFERRKRERQQLASPSDGAPPSESDAPGQEVANGLSASAADQVGSDVAAGDGERSSRTGRNDGGAEVALLSVGDAGAGGTGATPPHPVRAASGIQTSAAAPLPRASHRNKRLEMALPFVVFALVVVLAMYVKAMRARRTFAR